MEEPNVETVLRKVVLFSGHMIDAPGRMKTRFPPDKEQVAARAITAVLDDLDIGACDVCICSGACGGDLLFAEAALARSARIELYLPFEEPEFLKRSVDFANCNWRERFIAAKSRAAVHVLSLERGPTGSGENPYECNNLWMLEAASRLGRGRLDFVCLWNGEGGDGPGGTRHMMEEVCRRGGRAVWLNTKKLWG